MNSKHNIDLLLALSSHLVGEVPPSLRAACTFLNADVMHCYFYFNGNFSEEEKESLDLVSTYAFCNFSENRIINTHFERLDFPAPLPNIGVYAFSRDTLIKDKIPRLEMMHLSLEIQGLLCARQAFFGQISSNFRAFGIKKSEEMFEMFIFLNEKQSSQDLEKIEKAFNEFSTDFPELVTKLRILEIPYPQEIPSDQFDFYVFYKKESPVND